MLYWGCIHCDLGYRWFLALPFGFMTVLSFSFASCSHFNFHRVSVGKRKEKDFLRGDVALSSGSIPGVTPTQAR
jgi:hypothetical protein